ncbi:XRE family transcriptional regulator [Leucobacter viscericola]|uniref:XRE family transcriptional regulator n=1 Tax=Leucobacter viscericola TaxID=2714935 RepID=A0A6G7XE13_9MICO|nr:XRE family transcriptional regulator [Leucobacter viscericola]QIK62637.1 XRE family transcriptional regulator [Leucobacter viscericola]
MSYPTLDAAPLIKRARADLGMTQKELASASGVQQSNLSQIESGARIPSAAMLDRVLKAARLRPSIPLEIYAPRVVEKAAEYGLSNVRVFGSVVDGTDNEDSDVDLLVAPGVGFDLLQFAAFRQEIIDILGFDTDVIIDYPGDAFVEQIREQAVAL